MDIFHDDLLKNKYFLVIVAVIVLIIGVNWFISYNSVESKCERYAENLTSVFGKGSGSLRDMAVKQASKTVIDDCIKRGGPAK